MLLPCLLALLGFVSAQQSARELRPCFQRYANIRLVNVKPYHSEWRMKSEDNCLSFCSDTASRCRSIVYDSVQHICHFFLDEGADVTVPAAKMIYLRVVSTDCLTRSQQSNEVNSVHSQEDLAAPSAVAFSSMEDEHDLQSMQFTIPPTSLVKEEMNTELPATTEMTTEAVTLPSTTVVPVSEMPSSHLVEMWRPVKPKLEEYANKPLKEEFMEKSLEKEYLENPLKEENMDANVLRDINAPISMDRRWQSSMEQLTKNTDDLMFKSGGDVLTSTEAMSSSETAYSSIRGKENMSLSKRLQQKLEQLKEKHPDRYVDFLAGKSRNSFPITKDETTTTSEAEVLEANVMNTASFITPTKPKSPRAQFFAKRINFSDDYPFVRKQKEGGETDIRRQEPRKPKQVKLNSAPSFMHKARSFLSNILGGGSGDDSSKQIESSAELTAPQKACSTGHHIPIWLSFENSVGSEFIDSSYVKDLKACKNMCDENCNSFTYFDDGQCMINVDQGGVHLRRPKRDQLATRTDLKFCYPDNIEAYNDCSTFAGYRDHTLNVEPREVFDGLPPGYEGLKLCMELCVLSTQYTCRSASYLTLEGTCSLSDKDSSQAPSRFERSDVVGQLYIENGCIGNYAGSLRIDDTAVSIQRVTMKPKISIAKALQVKPIKSRRRSTKSRGIV
ncbi:unnamed protein product [Cylicocyclus nassatus]|uniref:Apple domain-containing protein n=1 Tax=Cylicocyclus nassatus TaxID=53992 RepID=A0AA36HAQ6_CYLNA|nr:unnamed protein product [Cylicocyclus nassatus]